MESSQKFRKSERLCSKKRIQDLFDKGDSFGVYPFRLVWLQNISAIDPMARIVISVPKKRFKRAVDRNLIKRRIRESYRKRKTVFYEALLELNTKIDFVLIYVGDEKMDYMLIDAKISTLLIRFEWEIKNKK